MRETTLPRQPTDGRPATNAFQQPLGFAALSGAGWILDLALFWALLTFAVAPGLANVGSATVAAMTVYAAARRLLFGGQGNAGKGFLLYFAYTEANIAFLGLVIQVLATALLGMHILENGVQAGLLAKIAVTPFSLAANFLVARALSRGAAHA